MSTPQDEDPQGDDKVVLNRTPPEEGYELYLHRNSKNLATKGWHGYFWARHNGAGDYEIRSVPTSEGEHSVPGGVFPKEDFERLYKKVTS
jgi:hypothetical protein